MILLEEKATKEDVIGDILVARGVDITKVKDHIVIILIEVELDIKLSITELHGKVSQKDKNTYKIKVNNLNLLIILSPITLLELMNYLTHQLIPRNMCPWFT